MRAKTDSIRVLDGQNRDNSDKTIIQSVEKEGVLVPLLVYEENGELILAAGHRRLASAIHFGLADVPVEVIPKDKAEAARALENLDRKGLHPLDEATEIRTLQSQGYDNGVISAMLGMSKSKVIRRGKLNNLISEIRQSVLDGETSIECAEEYSVMTPDNQEAIFKKLHKSWNGNRADSVRSEYLSSQGLRLYAVNEDFLKAAPACGDCPNNVASDKDLFESDNGSCRDAACFCLKMKSRMDEYNVTSLYMSQYNNDEKIEKALKKHHIEVVKKDATWRFTKKKDKDHPNAVMSIWGDVSYEPEPEKKPKVDPSVAKRKKELSKQYNSLYTQMREHLEKMVFEHADAYIDKYHKDERFPDNDERVILAKYALGSGWQLSGFVTGKKDYNTNPLKGADNKRILAVVLLFCMTGAHDNQELWPHKIDQGGPLLLPKSVEIADMYQLKTSKARKRVMEIKAEMEGLLEEYKKLES